MVMSFVMQFSGSDANGDDFIGSGSGFAVAELW